MITGEYEFLHDAPVHPHRRSVRWIKTGVSRGLFPQKALYEIGSALTLFKVKKNVQVFERFLEFGAEDIAPSIKRLLVRFGYPPDKQPEAIKLVMEQMESMAPRFAEGAALNSFLEFCHVMSVQSHAPEAVGAEPIISREGFPNGCNSRRAYAGD